MRLLLANLVLCLSVSGAFGGALPTANFQFSPVDMDEVRLGQLLFSDPVLSGRKTVSCATCHHLRFGTSDGLPLGMGGGGNGLGPGAPIRPR